MLAENEIHVDFNSWHCKCNQICPCKTVAAMELTLNKCIIWIKAWQYHVNKSF